MAIQYISHCWCHFLIIMCTAMAGKPIYFPSLGFGLCLGYKLQPFCLLLLKPTLLWGWSLCFRSRPSQPQIYLLISSFNSVGKSHSAWLVLCRPKNPVAKWRELFVCEPVNFWSFLKSCLLPLRPNKEEDPQSRMNHEWASAQRGRRDLIPARILFLVWRE